MNIREKLFSGWHGCSNHGCIVTGPKKGIGTNGSCHCIIGASRSQLSILQGRLHVLINEDEKSENNNMKTPD